MATVTRRLSALSALIAILLVALDAAPAHATPPGIPSKTQGTMTGYSRDLFPHWSTVSGTCNTRKTVLERDGVNVVVDSSCAAT